jgi:hypothetical protein
MLVISACSPNSLQLKVNKESIYSLKNVKYLYEYNGDIKNIEQTFKGKIENNDISGINKHIYKGAIVIDNTMYYVIKNVYLVKLGDQLANSGITSCRSDMAMYKCNNMS